MNPTIVICSGGWPLAEFFEPVRQAFEAQGFPAVCRVSPGYPDHDPSVTSTINPDTKYLRENVLEPLITLDAKDVVLFMHSYGGIYGPSSLEGLSKRERTERGLKGGVVALVFVTAFVARKGTSAMSAMGIDPENIPDWIDYDVSAVPMPSWPRDYVVAQMYLTFGLGNHWLGHVQERSRKDIAVPRSPRRGSRETG
jgi:hypothetical protein